MTNFWYSVQRQDACCKHFPLSMGCRLDVPKTEHQENCIRNQCVGYMDRTFLCTGDKSSGRSLVLDANGGGIGPGLLARSYL